MAPSSFPPSTPISKPSPAVDNQTPGTWRHPRLNEIVRRQNAATFSQRNVRGLVYNGAVLFVLWIFGHTFKYYLSLLCFAVRLPTYSDLSLSILRLYLFVNIITALYPLFRPKDDLVDIPLTPSQRSLLGLDPRSTPPATPGTQYITPPRYRLSASRVPSPGSRPSSPLSIGENSSMRASSFSPSASPLFQKAIVNGNKATGRRLSIGSSSLNLSFKDSTGMRTPASPSPVGSKGGSLGLSNKWLYEKSRRHSAGNGLF